MESFTTLGRIRARGFMRLWHVGTLVAWMIPLSGWAQEPCVPYPPTEATQVIDSLWAEQFERHDYAFTVPDDPGGGFVTARIETTPPSRAQMRIIPPSGQGVVTQNAPSFPGPSLYLLEVAFEVDAGSTFDVEIFEDAVSQPADFPVPYRWSWTFTSRVDCYEPSDALPSEWPSPTTVSSTIPLDEVVEAYSVAGHQTYVIAAFEAHNFDWYDFSLESPTEIWAALLEVPNDQSLRLRLFDAAGMVVADAVPPAGETAEIGPIHLEAGTYYLDIHPEVRGEAQVTLSEGESIPDHFDRPYRFIVSTQGPPQ